MYVIASVQAIDYIKILMYAGSFVLLFMAARSFRKSRGRNSFACLVCAGVATAAVVLQATTSIAIWNAVGGTIMAARQLHYSFLGLLLGCYVLPGICVMWQICLRRAAARTTVAMAAVMLMWGAIIVVLAEIVSTTSLASLSVTNIDCATVALDRSVEIKLDAYKIDEVTSRVIVQPYPEAVLLVSCGGRQFAYGFRSVIFPRGSRNLGIYPGWAKSYCVYSNSHLVICLETGERLLVDLGALCR